MSASIVLNYVGETKNPMANERLGHLSNVGKELGKWYKYEQHLQSDERSGEYPSCPSAGRILRTICLGLLGRVRKCTWLLLIETECCCYEWTIR